MRRQAAQIDPCRCWHDPRSSAISPIPRRRSRTRPLDPGARDFLETAPRSAASRQSAANWTMIPGWTMSPGWTMGRADDEPGGNDEMGGTMDRTVPRPVLAIVLAEDGPRRRASERAISCAHPVPHGTPVTRPPAAAAQYRLGVGAIDLPQALDRPQIARRIGANGADYPRRRALGGAARRVVPPGARVDLGPRGCTRVDALRGGTPPPRCDCDHGSRIAAATCDRTRVPSPWWRLTGGRKMGAPLGFPELRRRSSCGSGENARAMPRR